MENNKEKLAGDEHLGEWVYCDQHLRPHRTGWCTVPPANKVPLDIPDEGCDGSQEDAAYALCRAMGVDIYGEDRCEECGAYIPTADGGSIANRHHADSCSLHEPEEE